MDEKERTRTHVTWKITRIKHPLKTVSVEFTKWALHLTNIFFSCMQVTCRHLHLHVNFFMSLLDLVTVVYTLS